MSVRENIAFWLPPSVLCLVVVTACSLPEAKPDLTRFFLLTALAQKSEAAAAAEPAPRVVLRSALLPEYLRGKIMQVRLSENEVRFVDEAHWAEPLEAGLNRVLRENLEARANAVQLVAHNGDDHDYEVAIQFRRCEGVLPDGVARLAAHIDVYSGELNPKRVAQDDFTTDVGGWNGKDYGQLAKKLSEAAVALSDRIVALLPAKK